MLGLFLTPTILDGHNVFADHISATVSIPAGSGASPDAPCVADNSCFMPAEVTVDVGGEVTWSNDDTAAHTVTSGDFNVDPDNVGTVFDSSLFMAGKTFSHKFDAAGEYPYFCMVHPWMVGTVLVEDSSTTYYDTYLTLEVKASSTAGSIQVYPQLTSRGNDLGTNDIKIYVDGTWIKDVSSNNWSEDIFTGAGLHTIRAESTEGGDANDPSVFYESSSDEKSYTVSGIIQPPLPPTPPTPPIPPPSDGSAIVIVLVIVGAVGAGVGITLSKRKKKLPAIQTPYVKSSSTLIKLDDTQFWVCPHCGKDTEAYYGKQYCRSCNVYL